MTKRHSMATRRAVLKSAAGTGFTGLLGNAWGQSFDFKPNQRYPDPALLIPDPSFAKYRLYSSTLEQVASGMRWAEGPVYFPDGGYLLVSDIPNNRIMKYSEKDGSFTVFRSPSNYANGNTRDRQGRLVTCEHSVTRRITRTEQDGKITVLADSFEGRRLNAPNDIVVKSDDSIWFSDPLVGGRKVYQLKGRSEDLDGVTVFSPQGKPLAFLRLPERCANLTFGGPKNNRLYMASSHSVYAMYFETHGAV